MVGQQRLVGRDDVFAVGDRRLDQILGGACIATDKLDDHIHVIAGGQGGRIVLPSEARQVHAAILGPVPCGDGGDDDGAARPCGQKVGALLDDAHDASAHGPQTGDT